MSNITFKEVRAATAKIRRELRACEDAAIRSNALEAYSAAERAGMAAFDLKMLFAIPSVDAIKPDAHIVGGIHHPAEDES